MQKVTDWVYRLMDSARVFLVAVILLVAQSTWLAFSAIYPMPFDEYMHVGVISIYARQLSPIISVQPPEASLFGDITRTGSYLYHYLMSFPYRVLDVFIDNQVALVVSLRLMNIAMVVAALFLFRKLFNMWKIPRRVQNIIFILFVFTPLVPFLAAHVNYDNLILLLTPIVLIFATRLIVDKGDVAWNGVWFAFFGLVALITKETFLPLYAVISVYVVWRLWREHNKKFVYDLAQSFWLNMRQWTFILALLSLLVVGGLVVERYGGNLVRYNKVIVECEAVQPESVCEDFGPWLRDKLNKEGKRRGSTAYAYGNPVSYSQYWVSRTVRGFFVPFTHTPTDGASKTEPYGPILGRAVLPLQFGFGSAALAFGIVCVLLQIRYLWRNKQLRFALVVCVGYVMVLWLYNYSNYLRIGQAEAIQARYSYPVLLLMFLVMVQAVSQVLKSRRARSWLMIATFVCFIWGGGIAAWIIRADNRWMWQNPTVQSANEAVHNILIYTTPN